MICYVFWLQKYSFSLDGLVSELLRFHKVNLWVIDFIDNKTHSNKKQTNKIVSLTPSQKWSIFNQNSFTLG